jgi:hypothetical protein
MSDNIRVTINDKESFTGRLIGVIDEQECRAIMNTEDAARRIFSAESVKLSEVLNVLRKKRFVIATTDYSSDKRREVFISPIIKFLSWKYANKIFKCEDDNDYQLKEI